MDKETELNNLMIRLNNIIAKNGINVWIDAINTRLSNDTFNPLSLDKIDQRTIMQFYEKLRNSDIKLSSNELKIERAIWINLNGK